MLMERTRGPWLRSCPRGWLRHGKELGASQHMGIKVRHESLRLLLGRAENSLFLCKNSTWGSDLAVSVHFSNFVSRGGTGQPHGMPQEMSCRLNLLQDAHGMSQELLQGLKGLIYTQPQPQLVAISQVSTPAAVKPSDHINSPTCIGLILAWRWRWKISCLFAVQLHPDLVMISSVFLEI